MTGSMAAARSSRKSRARQMFGGFSARSSKNAAGADGIAHRTSVRLGQTVAELVRAACPVKPAENLAAWAGIGTRAAEHVLAGRNGLSLDAFFHLLHSPIGRALWDAAWELGPMPDWHARQQLLLEIAEAERRADEARAEYAALKKNNR